MHTFVHAVNISNVYIRLDEAWIHVQWHTNINKIRAQILCKWKQSILWTHDNNRHSLLGSSWMTWGYGVLCFHAKGDVPVVWATRSPNQNCSTWDLLFLNRFLCPINHCNPIRTCNVKNSMKASTPVSNPPRSSRRSNSNSDFHCVIRVNLWDELNFTPISRAHICDSCHHLWMLWTPAHLMCPLPLPLISIVDTTLICAAMVSSAKVLRWTRKCCLVLARSTSWAGENAFSLHHCAEVTNIHRRINCLLMPPFPGDPRWTQSSTSQI